MCAGSPCYPPTFNCFNRAPPTERLSFPIERSSNHDGKSRHHVAARQPWWPHHRRPAPSHRFQGHRHTRTKAIAQPIRLPPHRNRSPASPQLVLRSSHPHHTPPFRRGRLKRRQHPLPCRCALRGIEPRSYPRPPSGERRWRARLQDCFSGRRAPLRRTRLAHRDTRPTHRLTWALPPQSALPRDLLWA